jgi:hypothetical protein
MSEATTAVTCPGCQGEGYMVTRVQRLTPQGRRCTVQRIPCLLCQGAKTMTLAAIQAWEAQWLHPPAAEPPAAGEGEG